VVITDTLFSPRSVSDFRIGARARVVRDAG
jgi:hypothetical protein